MTAPTRNAVVVLRSLGLLAAALSLLLVGSAARAAGETTGRVAGFVFDPTKAPLAEVPLTIRGTSMMQAETRTTGEDGRFEFSQLPPGEDYVIEVNVPGFAPIKKGGIAVHLGQTTPIDINLDVLTETNAVATYEIVEKVNPSLNPDSAQSGTVVTHEKAELTPVFHQVQAMASQVAGVGPGTNPSTRGGFARYGKYYVDGMDTSDVTDGSFTAPMNFDVVENFEIITGGFDAQYNSLGLVQNVVTKSGKNKFEHDINLTWSPPAFNARPKVASGQPAFVQEYTNNPAIAPLKSFFSPVVNLGGPIIQDKLWFYASGQLNRNISQVLVTSAYEPLEARSTVTYTTLARLKLTYQATTKDLISVAFNFDHNNIDNADGSQFTTPSGEYKIHRGGFFIVTNYDHTFTDSLLFQLQAGMTNKIVNQDPEVEGVSHTDINARVTQFSSGSISFSNPGNSLHESKQRFQFDPSLSWKLGNHQLKGGIQLSGQVDAQIASVTGTQRYADKNGVCDPANSATFSSCFQRTDFYNANGDAAPLLTHAGVFTAGVFLQDRWNVSRKLTIIPGMRFDLGELFNEQGAFATLTGFGPRISGTYDVQGDRKKLITAHYGRSNDVGNVFIAQHANPTLTQVLSTFNGTAFPTCTINSPAAGCTTSGGARLFQSNPTAPHVDEVAVGYRQEAAPLTVVGAEASYRRYSNEWADIETNRIFDATGTQIIGYRNGVKQSITQAATPDSAYREYEGLDLWVQGNPGKWDLLASYTLAFSHGTVDDYFDGYLANPRFTQFYDGYVNDDRRHTLKGSIAYTTDWGLDLGFRLQYRTGTPLWEAFVNPADSSQRTYRSPRGTGFAFTSTGTQNFNDPTGYVNLRNPDTMQIDLQARYNLGKLLGISGERIELAAFLFNALNTLQAQSLSGSFARSTLYGLVSSRQSPLQLEVFLRVRNF